jgi:hypothetical protein
MRVVWRAAAAAVVVVMATQAGFAAPLFVNPGFETGDFTGWSVVYSGVGGPGEGPLVGLPSDGSVHGTGYEDAVVVPVGWGTDPYTLGTVPKVAPPTALPNLYSARIGDADNQINHLDPPGGDDDPQSVQLSQIGVVTELVSQLAVRWSAAVTEPANVDEHEPDNFPFFQLRVVNLGTDGVGGGIADVELLNVMHTSHELGAFWTLDGAQGVINDPDNVYQPTRDPTTPGDWWYKDWTTESWDMSGAGLGDLILIELTAHDCGLRGHPAYVRLDDIGIPEVPPIPEPTTMLLLVGGVAVAGWRARKRLSA